MQPFDKTTNLGADEPRGSAREGDVTGEPLFEAHLVSEMGVVSITHWHRLSSSRVALIKF